jgi:hypothetical protein
MFGLAIIKALNDKYPRGYIGGANFSLSRHEGHNPDIINNPKARELEKKNNKRGKK